MTDARHEDAAARDFAVWAPHAAGVSLQLGQDGDDKVVALAPRPHGWWSVSVAYDGPYRYLIDGVALPDPRSPSQPEGADGPSHTLDHGPHSWGDARWQGPGPLADAVLYELHVGTFTPDGTFDGVAARLDDLVDLGVDAIELMPVGTFAGPFGWGYDGVDLFAPYCGYGGPEGLKRLVDSCHARGLAVVLDVVYNHLGPAHNYLGRFGPYFTDIYRTPWGDAVNLDGPGSDEVRRFFCDNACAWLRDYHIDGLRVDAVHALLDRSAVHVLEQLEDVVRAEARRLGRRVWLIAESDRNDPRLVLPREVGGGGFDALWSDDLHHSLHATLTGERSGYYADFGTVADLAKALQDTYVYDGRYSPFRDRAHGRSAAGVPRRCFLGYSQTHDQIGNRAFGERLVHLAGADGAAIAATLVLLGPAVPMLFQGEEWGASTPFRYFADHGDPDLRRLVREGRRAEFASFGWTGDVPDPASAETFDASTLNWAERSQSPHRELLQFYRELIRLRRGWLRGAELPVTVSYQEPTRWLALSHGPIVVAVNLAEFSQVVPLTPAEVSLAIWGATPGASTNLSGDGSAISLSGRAAAVLGPAGR